MPSGVSPTERQVLERAAVRNVTRERQKCPTSCRSGLSAVVDQLRSFLKRPSNVGCGRKRPIANLGPDNPLLPDQPCSAARDIVRVPVARYLARKSRFSIYSGQFEKRQSATDFWKAAASRQDSFGCTQAVPLEVPN